jgi:hypothetical protein
MLVEFLGLSRLFSPQMAIAIPKSYGCGAGQVDVLVLCPGIGG